MRNKLFQESRTRNCQEIEELRRICCEETDRARQIRIDEWSMQQDRIPTTVSLLLTQIQDLQNKVNSLADAREFYDPETAASSSGAFYVPSQPFIIRAPEECQAAILHCRTMHGTVWVHHKNVFESLPARQGQPSNLFENSRNLASSSPGLRLNITGNTMVPEREVRREPQDSSIPVPRFQKGAGIVELILTVV